VAQATRFATARDGGAPGLRVERWANEALAGPPESTGVEPIVRVGVPLDMAVMASGEPYEADVIFGNPRPMGARWTGWYTPEPKGPHDVVVQLGGFMDAGWRLRVDGRLVADRWGRNEAIVEAVSVPLTAAPHELVLEFHAGAGFGTPYLRMGIVGHDAWVDPDAVALAERADAVIVAVGLDAMSEAENWDRAFALPPGQDALVERVLAAHPDAVVVVTGGGGTDMTRWVDRARAVLQAWYPGQEGGRALAEILFGDVSPSGRLPATFERRETDNPAHAHYYPVPGTDRVEYAEGVFVGYRGYERAGVAPLFPFGHGLTYTTFAYANLAVAAAAGQGAPGWDVSFDVTNAGARAAAAVAQLYVADVEASVPRPAKELRGFAKVALAPGETRRVTLPLDPRALSFWDEAAGAWRAEAGAFEVLVGESSADVRLRGALVLDRTLAIGAAQAPPASASSVTANSSG
jgi:beta-glucosidase